MKSKIPRRRFISRTLQATGALAVSGLLPSAELRGQSGPGSRFNYLEERDPYYPNLHFPKLTTPMWVGEKGVDAVVLLTVDDMGRERATGKIYQPFAELDLSPQVYSQVLRPLAERLKQIDGRAPITIFANQVEPENPLLQRLLQEGLSIEVHSLTHPLPLLRADSEASLGRGSLRLPLEDVVDGLANLRSIPNNRPVAFRVPGFDARNVVSPRFFCEVLPARTPRGDFLAADSSIVMVFSSKDPSLPKQWVLDSEGRERFGKYLTGMSGCRHYSNCIFDYPYPYVIDHLIWEFPPIIPADSHGVHLHDANSPRTVEDWKRAMDLTVLKKGLLTLCFHPEKPHGYIKSEQVTQLIDYVDRTYGGRVKFLNCKEIHDRLTNNLLDGQPLRSKSGADNGVRLLDVNGDGYLDVVIGNSQVRRTKIWQPELGTWRSASFPISLVESEDTERAASTGVHFFAPSTGGEAGLAISTPNLSGVWRFDGEGWAVSEAKLPRDVDQLPLFTNLGGVDRGVRFRDLDRDGISDLIVNNESQNAVFFWRPSSGQWERADFSLPQPACLVDAKGADQGLRFVDLDGDGFEDLILSNDREYWICLFEGPSKGWSKPVAKGAGGGALPPIVHQGAINGVWFHSGALNHANEFTQRGDSGWITRIPFEDLLKGAFRRRRP